MGCEAINRMKRALDELVILGVKTNIEFHKEILNNKEFIENRLDTSFIEKVLFRKNK